MIDEQKLAAKEQAASLNQASRAHAEHDCHAWNIQHYYSSPSYQMAQCGVCGQVTGFRWRSWWMRVRSLFTDNPMLTKIVDPDP